ncbi:MAG: hypothetical protein BJ554DRAFT_5363, partial [Olpidium bornovanus]
RRPAARPSETGQHPGEEASDHTDVGQRQRCELLGFSPETRRALFPPLPRAWRPHREPAPAASGCTDRRGLANHFSHVSPPDISNLTVLGCSAIFLLCPLMVVYFWVSCNSYRCALLGPFHDLQLRYILTNSLKEALVGFAEDELPRPTLYGFVLYAGWLVFQGLCYAFLPAVNGLLAWTVSLTFFLAGCLLFKLYPGSIIHDNWGALLVATNVYGYFLTFFVYAKAHLFPSHPEDRKFSGSVVYDVFMGVEFNPRFGELWDFKLFHNGRPGII